MKLWSYVYNLGAFILKGFKAKSVKDFYDSAAANYDEAMRMQNYLVGAIIEHMPECDTALDIAMGTGITSDHMSKKCKRLVSLDFSDSMINEAKTKNLEAHILKADFLDLPLKDNSIDVAVCTRAIGHIPLDRYYRFFSEVSRVSRQFITESRDFTFMEVAYYRIFGKIMSLLGHSEQPLNSGKKRLEEALQCNCFDTEFIPFGDNKRNYIVIAKKRS